MEFLTALQSTEGRDCADAELANTKSDIESIRMGCPRSEPRSRLDAISRSTRGWPSQSTIIRYLCRSSQLDSSIAALTPRALAAKARATIKLSQGQCLRHPKHR